MTDEGYWESVFADEPPDDDGEPGPEPSRTAKDDTSRQSGEDNPNWGGPTPLAHAEAAFTKWLGAEYDLDALRATLAAAACERLDGDPIWMLLISGSGNAKTETVQALSAVATITSTIASEGALLSATSRKERSQQATGGLLRKLGTRGILVVKDVTSILSMHRDTRAAVLAALREVYDGLWARNVGSDGGQTLEWSGRLITIGAVTTAWDAAHSVISAMGDRFVLVRMDSTTGRMQSGRRAIRNTGEEAQMRAELAEAATWVLDCAHVETPYKLTDDDIETLLAVADLVTLSRTAVERDYQGNVIDAHAPEMPTRFAKQLTQILRGGVAIGMQPCDALQLAVRCGRDSMPPLRLAIIEDVASHPYSTSWDVSKRIDKPRTTVDREMQGLHMLGVFTCDEEPWVRGEREGTRWCYSLKEGIDPTVFDLAAQRTRSEAA